MRDSWNEYFMNIAKEVSKRATCDRLHVGTVLVKNNRILATGYNGSMSKAPHCDDVGHMMEGGHCIATVHAEANAVAQAARYGVSVDESSCYVTALPCWNCFKLLVNSGIKEIFYSEVYGEHPNTIECAKKLNIGLYKI